MERLDPADFLTADVLAKATAATLDPRIAPIVCEDCGKSFYRMYVHPSWLLPEHQDDLAAILEATDHHCSTKETH